MCAHYLPLPSIPSVKIPEPIQPSLPPASLHSFTLNEVRLLNRFDLVRYYTLGSVSVGLHRDVLRASRLSHIGLSNEKEIVGRDGSASSAGGTSGICAMDFENIESRYLLSGTLDGTINLYDLSNDINSQGYQAAPLQTLQSPVGLARAVNSICWYPLDTGMFFSAMSDGSIRVYDTNTFDAVLSMSLGGAIRVDQIALSPIAKNHSLIASTHAFHLQSSSANSTSHIRLCDIRTGATTHTLMGHQGGIGAIEWSPTAENSLVSGSIDKTIRFWDIRRAGCLMILDQSNSFETKVNKTFINTYDSYIRRDVHSHDAPITQLRLTSDGLHLISFSASDHRMMCWDAWHGRNLLVHYDPLLAKQRLSKFTFSADNRIIFKPDGTDDLYSGGNDKQILVWSGGVHATDRLVQVETNEDNPLDDEHEDFNKLLQREAEEAAVAPRHPTAAALFSTTQAIELSTTMNPADKDNCNI